MTAAAKQFVMFKEGRSQICESLSAKHMALFVLVVLWLSSLLKAKAQPAVSLLLRVLTVIVGQGYFILYQLLKRC